jgi:uroporphyrinogen III methyltransferase/synthase
VLPEALRARGAEVDVVTLYETVIEALSEGQLEAVTAADYITVTSASSVHNLAEAAGGFPEGPRVVSIGPVTSEALRGIGHEADVTAEDHDLDGLIEALIADVAARA